MNSRFLSVLFLILSSIVKSDDDFESFQESITIASEMADELWKGHCGDNECGQTWNIFNQTWVASQDGWLFLDQVNCYDCTLICDFWLICFGLDFNCVSGKCLMQCTDGISCMGAEMEIEQDSALTIECVAWISCVFIDIYWDQPNSNAQLTSETQTAWDVYIDIVGPDKVWNSQCTDQYSCTNMIFDVYEAEVNIDCIANYSCVSIDIRSLDSSELIFDCSYSLDSCVSGRNRLNDNILNSNIRLINSYSRWILDADQFYDFSGNNITMINSLFRVNCTATDSCVKNSFVVKYEPSNLELICIKDDHINSCVNNDIRYVTVPPTMYPTQYPTIVTDEPTPRPTNSPTRATASPSKNPTISPTQFTIPPSTFPTMSREETTLIDLSSTSSAPKKKSHSGNGQSGKTVIIIIVILSIVLFIAAISLFVYRKRMADNQGSPQVDNGYQPVNHQG